MLQANKHISLVCGEPGSLSTFNIILLSERGFHCLLPITPLFDQTMLVKHESVSRPQISVFGVRSRPRVSVCWVQAVASSVYTHHYSGLSYRNCKGPITCHFHNLEQHLSHVTHCQVHLTRDMSLSSPGLSWHTLTLTTIMSWPESHLETEDGESSVGDRGECTLVHAGALYCRLYNVNGKFYYFSNTSPMNLHSYI